MINNEKNGYPIMIIIIGIIGVICSLLGMWLSTEPMIWIKGVLFGTLFTMIKWMLMKNTVAKAVEMPQAKAQLYTGIHYTLRYMLTAIVLVVAALEPSISLLGTFAGLMTMKVATFVIILLGKADSIL